ncbi:hypothetical protein FC778_13440 [Clostridium botulinum]|nr:hypothetical protein [Clostridium botulinum]
MNINVRVLGWTDKCCGCLKNIPGTEKVFILKNIAGVQGTIHLCEKCIDDIEKSKNEEPI